MSKLVIEGGQSLTGTIRINGMKNAAGPIIAATILTKEECLLKEVPQITDVEKMLGILRDLGAKVERQGHQVSINCRDINLESLNRETIKAMRFSVLLIGPLLSRFKSLTIPEPGGCLIGNRPIDFHLTALEKLGAKISRDNGNYILTTDGLKGTTIILPGISVTATENIIMAAVLAQGKTIIKLAAAEPHVQDLIAFLNKLGAKIKEIGTRVLEIEGVKELKGAEHTIIPGYDEAGTFAVAAAVTKGKIKIENVIPEHLDIVLLKLQQIGVKVEVGQDYLIIEGKGKFRNFKLQTMPYPGFATDLQAPFALLATQCQGTSLIHETIFEGRLGYINELIKMGANATICDPHRVLITGPTPLYGQNIKSLDLRAGATMILAGLTAQGQTTINEAEIIDRGYEQIVERLSSLGANIKRIK